MGRDLQEMARGLRQRASGRRAALSPGTPVHVPCGLDHRVAELAASVRLPADPRQAADLPAIATSLDVRVRSIEGLGPLEGVFYTKPREMIAVNATLTATRQRVALAHELGHVLLERRSLPWVTPRIEEQFCDWFAFELLVPGENLVEALADPIAVADRLQVDLEVVAAQLAAAGALSPVMRVGARIVCARCGDRAQAWQHPCPCEPYREDAELAATLRDFSATFGSTLR